MRRAARTDANQTALVQALRKVGARVLHLHQVGNGCPDLLVAFRKRNILLEVKRPGEKPNKEQQEFIDAWDGEVHVVHSVEEAVNAVVNTHRPGYPVTDWEARQQ